jgi:hypothetical protein
MTFLVRISDHHYAVDDDDLKGFESRILAAARAGGAFVDVPGPVGQPVRVLVTAATAVSIERPPRPVEASPMAESDMMDIAFLDLEI